MDYPPVHAVVATVGIVFNWWLLWKMTKKFVWQRSIAEELDEIRLRYKHMLDEFTNMLDEEKRELAETKCEIEEDNR